MEQSQNHGTIQVPDEVKRWNWGAFLLGPIWGLFNGVLISLLMLIPVLGFIMPFVLGFKGSEWAWKKKRWESVEHFKRVQKRWAWAGLAGLVLFIMVGVATVGDDPDGTIQTMGTEKTTSSGNPAGKTDSPGKKSAKIGDTIQVGELEYTILRVESKKEIKDPMGSVYKPGAGQYLVVEVQVKNKGKDKYTIDTSMFVLKDKQGAEYSADPSADLWVNGSGSDALGFFLKPLNPHAVKKGKVVFDVPNQSAENFVFEAKGGFLSGETGAIELKK